MDSHVGLGTGRWGFLTEGPRCPETNEPEFFPSLAAGSSPHICVFRNNLSIGQKDDCSGFAPVHFSFKGTVTYNPVLLDCCMLIPICLAKDLDAPLGSSLRWNEPDSRALSRDRIPRSGPPHSVPRCIPGCVAHPVPAPPSAGGPIPAPERRSRFEFCPWPNAAHICICRYAQEGLHRR